MGRAYTVKELDALRRVVERKWSFGVYGEMPEPIGHTPGQSYSYTGRSYYGNEMTEAVEELVRTHMLAGHTAEDLIASEK